MLKLLEYLCSLLHFPCKAFFFFFFKLPLICWALEADAVIAPTRERCLYWWNMLWTYWEINYAACCDPLFSSQASLIKLSTGQF